MSVPDRFWCWTATGADGRVVAILNCFAGSPSALTGLAVDGGAATWTARVVELRPDLVPVTSAAVLTTLRDDPWALGPTVHRGLRTSIRSSSRPRSTACTSRVSMPQGRGAGSWKAHSEAASWPPPRSAMPVLFAGLMQPLINSGIHLSSRSSLLRPSSPDLATCLSGRAN